MVNAKDRRLVVCESILCPSQVRETLAKVLFIHFEVSTYHIQELFSIDILRILKDLKSMCFKAN